jgi:hypothetical protein
MRFARLLFVGSILVPLSAAFADGSGEVTHSGTTVKLTNAYAFRTADHFDKTQSLTEIILSSAPIDTAKANAASDREAEIQSQLDAKRASYVEISIGADGLAHQLDYAEPGFHTSGSTMDHPVLTHNDDKRIEGTFRTADEKKKTAYSAYFDLKFALDVAAQAAGAK